MRRNLSVLLLLVTLTLGAFLRVKDCAFVNYDDNDYVTANPIVQKGLTREGFAWAFSQLHADKTYWHPLTWLSHMLDCQLFGLQPAGHHLMSLFFHALNAALLFLTLRRMTGSLWRSALVAAFWAVHPLQVDSVAWVTERKNLLCTLFWVLTTGAYVCYAARPNVARYLLVVLGMALGLMCKPVLVTLPCALLLLDVWPLRRFAFARSPALPGASDAGPTYPVAAARRIIVEKVPLFGLAALSSWITVQAHVSLNVTQKAGNLPTGLRFENAFVSYVRYLKKIFWPDDLAVFYPHPGIWPAGAVWGSLLVLLAITGVVVWRARRAPYLAIGWFWFVGVLVPAIGILQVGSQAMADRFVYQPLIGLLILVVWGAADWAAVWRPRENALIALTAVALLGCVGVTWRQIGFWRDSLSLYERAVAVTRNNSVMHSNLAFTLREAGRLEEAREQGLAAVQANPNHFPAYLLLALICEGLNRPEEAAVHYQRALSFQPRWLEAMKGYGNLLARAGKLEAAYAQLQPLSELTPDDPEVHSQLALILSARKQPADAIRHYREALRLRPDWPDALNNLAWLLATQPDAQFRDGPAAIRLAERACELTQRKEIRCLGTLAAAYAEAGRFEDAATTARQAIALATTAGDKERAATNEKLLELYRARKPYREDAR